MSGKAGHRGFGNIKKLPSGRFRATYPDPDGRTHVTSRGTVQPVRHSAPQTFETKADAEAWLTDRRREIHGGNWVPPSLRVAPMTFREHAERWLEQRDLKPRTRQGYRKTLDTKLLPTFGDMPLKYISIDTIDAWYYRLDPSRPTARSHAYGLLRTIMGDAVNRRLLDHNPCHIRGAGNVKRASSTKPATLEELATLVDEMPERFQLMTLLAAWCALRFGELTELRRGDIDLTSGVIEVRRGVVRVDEVPDVLPAHTKRCPCRPGCLIGPPKSDAGSRDVTIPPHLLPLVKAHLRDSIAGGRDGLLFPAADGGHLAPSALYGTTGREIVRGGKKVTKAGWGFYHARSVAGRPDLRFHDLRHTGAVLAAQTGATLAELMRRLGHSTPGAAMRYQHATDDRDAQIAKMLSALAEAL